MIDYPRWLHHKTHGSILVPSFDYAIRYSGESEGWHYTASFDSPVEPAQVDPPKNKGGRPRKENP